MTFAIISLMNWRALGFERTYVYAVQISATVHTSPPRIVLQWEPDPNGATRYTVFRKSRDSAVWGAPVALAGSASAYTDWNVAVGGTYEYQIVKATRAGYTGYGYIYSGINAPLRDRRGKLILLVDSAFAGPLASELAQLQRDLVGDGWQVLRHNVARDGNPVHVKQIIINHYYADPANVKAVFLFGHIPIFRSGRLNYDDHGPRSMPADTYYADVDGNWANSPSYLPSDAELMVGRVDFFNMTGEVRGGSWPSEVELLRNYLRKDHAWRHKNITVPQRALMGNRAGDEEGEASAATGYRNFQPLVGPGNIVHANIENFAPANERWISMLSAESYLWAYGNGGGDFTAISQLGTHGQYNDVWSDDIVTQDAKAVFSMLYGSHLGEWDRRDGILRSMLATPSYGLATFMGGRPHWYVHHMGLGEPIGHGARITMNNHLLYRTQSNTFARGVHIALHGDPSLRQDIVAPPYDVSASRNGADVHLSWSPSSDGVAGYHIYRAARSTGPYTRLTSRPINGTFFSDIGRVEPTWYMVRAIKLETTPSGSYWNASQGIFAFAPAPPSVQFSTRVAGNNLILTWSSQPGRTYRVLAKVVGQTVWRNASSTLFASGGMTSWTDVNFRSRPQRAYRVIVL